MRAARQAGGDGPKKTAGRMAKAAVPGGKGRGANGKQAGARSALGGQKDTDVQFVGNRAISGLTRPRTFDKV